jgi:iron complex transport system substrate-binding protein
VRIASLVPSATEILFALGLGDQVVAVTHECDHPDAAARLPRLTASVIPDGVPPAEIDARVREVTARGEALYTLDEQALSRLEPDLIVTQALCAVCAVSFDDVRSVADRLPSRPDVISLDPESLPEVLSDIGRVAEAAGRPELAAPLRGVLEARIDRVRDAVAGAAERPRVAALEWLDPPFAGGHWVPEMVAIAGGVDPVGRPGVRSRTVGWDELAAAEPDVAVVMPCGLHADEAAEQALAHRSRLESIGAGRVAAVDAASSFSRPGPRLVDGIELLAHLLHPDRMEAPEGLEWREVVVAPPRAPASGVSAGPGEPGEGG